MLKVEIIENLENENSVCNVYRVGNYEVEVIRYKNESNPYKVRAFSLLRDSYLPNIYTDLDWKTKELKIDIQTTSYGSLDMNEFKKFMDCQKEAVEVAAWIKNEFYK